MNVFDEKKWIIMIKCNLAEVVMGCNFIQKVREIFLIVSQDRESVGPYTMDYSLDCKRY